MLLRAGMTSQCIAAGPSTPAWYKLCSWSGYVAGFVIVYTRYYHPHAQQLLLAMQALLEKYFRLLPVYQGVPLAQLKFRRLLFGGFPCYQDAPLRPHFDRILQVCLQCPIPALLNLVATILMSMQGCPLSSSCSLTSPKWKAELRLPADRGRCCHPEPAVLRRLRRDAEAPAAPGGGGG